MSKQKQFLPGLGVYGYGSVEPVILAALVSEDPLLLVGRHGTGKTYLLNSLSEALKLEHRHYNASLVSFDDLVGFPFPSKDGSEIRFIETPATVWQAESVLIDEINRCKPEHQNRLFSLVHECRIQGMLLKKLRYRWAAMNPTGEDEGYIGTEPLDPALADRFAFVVPVADWEDLSAGEQLAVADPRGDGAISRDNGELALFLEERRSRYLALLKDIPALIPAYASCVASTLGNAGVRISPRRTRQLARNLIAVSVVSDLPLERLFLLVLRMSIPQVATGEKLPPETLIAAHRLAWDSVALSGRDKWLHDFLLQKSLAKKAELLLLQCPDPDTGSVAVAQLLACESMERQAAFTLAVTPFLLEWEDAPVGEDGISDLANLLREISDVKGSIKWIDPSKQNNWGVQPHIKSTVPGYKGALRTLGGPRSHRRKRGLQLLDFIVHSGGKVPDDWKRLIEGFEACLNVVVAIRKKVRRQDAVSAA